MIQDTTPSSQPYESGKVKRTALLLVPRGMWGSFVVSIFEEPMLREILSRDNGAASQQTPPTQNETPSSTIVNDPKGPEK